MTSSGHYLLCASLNGEPVTPGRSVPEVLERAADAATAPQKIGVSAMGTRNPEQDVIDRIDALVDEQMAGGEDGHRPRGYPRCPNCHAAWHGLPTGTCKGSHSLADWCDRPVDQIEAPSLEFPPEPQQFTREQYAYGPMRRAFAAIARLHEAFQATVNQGTFQAFGDD